MSPSILKRFTRIRILGKSPAGAFLRLNRSLWNRLSPSWVTAKPVRLYGLLLHRLVQVYATRKQFCGTFFFRNRPQLELMRRLANHNPMGARLKISVLGCSNGAEVYSILWTLRSARPDLTIVMNAVDVSREVLEFAQRGAYCLGKSNLVDEPIFDRTTEEEMREMFDKNGDEVRIKPWLKEGIAWHLADAGDPEAATLYGPQDMVVANNFLCHMEAGEAERCLRNIARLVSPGGYLFVSGIDLEVRTKIAKDLAWKPVKDLIEDIHAGDPRLIRDWPFSWWGMEPLNRRRLDWDLRYASVFQLS